MIKTIEIDGKRIEFKATASTPRVYRQAFGRDIYLDLTSLYEAISKDEPMSVEALETYENISFVMAMQGEGKEIRRESIEKDMENWLDQFSTFSIYQVVPQIMELWRLNTEQSSELKNQPALPSDQ
jgi:hypothetical protein